MSARAADSAITRAAAGRTVTARTTNPPSTAGAIGAPGPGVTAGTAATAGTTSQTGTRSTHIADAAGPTGAAGAASACGTGRAMDSEEAGTTGTTGAGVAAAPAVTAGTADTAPAGSTGTARTAGTAMATDAPGPRRAEQPIIGAASTTVTAGATRGTASARPAAASAHATLAAVSPRTAGTTGTGAPTQQRPVGTTGAAGPTVTADGCESGPGTAGTAGTSGTAQEPAGAASTAASSGPPVSAGATDPADTTVAEQKSRAADSTMGAWAAGPTSATTAKQAGRPSSPAGLTERHARPTFAAITNQDAAGPTRLAWRTVSPITNQRPPKQHIGGRIDRTQNVLLQGLQRRHVRGLGGGIQAATRIQRTHELVVKQCRPRTQCLKLSTEIAENHCDRRRDLISGRDRNLCRRARRCGVSLTECCSEAGQLRGSCAQFVGRGRYKRRHPSLPFVGSARRPTATPGDRTLPAPARVVAGKSQLDQLVSPNELLGKQKVTDGGRHGRRSRVYRLSRARR